MTNKLPAFQFYPGDWKKDIGIQSLNLEERGAWFELLLLMHESEHRGYLMLNGQPMSDEIIAKLLGILRKKWGKIRKKLENVGVASVDENTGCLFSRRMVRDEETRRICKDVGHLGGNPNFKKGKANPYYDNPKDNPPDNPHDNPKITSSSSSSTSSSSSDKNKEAVTLIQSTENVSPIKKEPLKIDILTLVTIPQSLNNQIGREAILTWLEYKHERGQKYKKRGLQIFLDKWAQVGAEKFARAVNHSASNNYMGCFDAPNPNAKYQRSGKQTLDEKLELINRG